MQTDSIEGSQRCLVTRVRLRNGCASHSHRIRTICNGLNRCVALFVLRKRERTARKYDFSPVVIESNTGPPSLFLSLPLLPCREHELFGIVDNVITAIYLRSLYWFSSILLSLPSPLTLHPSWIAARGRTGGGNSIRSYDNTPGESHQARRLIK